MRGLVETQESGWRSFFLMESGKHKAMVCSHQCHLAGRRTQRAALKISRGPLACVDNTHTHPLWFIHTHPLSVVPLKRLWCHRWRLCLCAACGSVSVQFSLQGVLNWNLHQNLAEQMNLKLWLMQNIASHLFLWASAFVHVCEHLNKGPPIK